MVMELRLTLSQRPLLKKTVQLDLAPLSLERLFKPECVVGLAHVAYHMFRPAVRRGFSQISVAL